MAVMVKCSQCHAKVSLKNSTCKCGNDLKKDKKKLYYIVYTFNGKKVWEHAGHSLKFAKELETKKKNDLIDRKVGQVNKELKNIVFSDFIDNQFTPHYRLKNKAFKSEKSRFKVIKEQLGDILLKSVTEYDIDKFLKYLQLERKISKSTINRYIATVKRMMNYAIELNIIVINPMRHIKQMPVSNERTRYLTNEEVERVLTECRRSRNKNLYYIVQVALKTGMRFSEVLTLKGKNVSLINRSIIIAQHNTKNGKQRFIPINDALYDVLVEYFNQCGSIGDEEKLFKNKSIRGAYENAIKRAEINDFNFHDLRHTFASRLVQKEVGLYTVSELLGHSNITVTKRYAHLNQKNLRDAVEKL
ncbi:tyrosine-type recombinase/integrase [Seleniivibrio woodruffii]|uniref:Site-specific recombinase XerD n=1 Tax=Seleniivibrio woodruffii TaxID=1078050 RepID=A0A4R1KBZ9_9BACT|nr:site-specific integrase [Seleniivibrio woodruffii]TCK61550.1 site-specific recombinase XerD [Seleniivibrio woodruffii]TVZ35335.1 site-specific recombinase XerD [Seleniivibrio woodruffii]